MRRGLIMLAAAAVALVAAGAAWGAPDRDMRVQGIVAEFAVDPLAEELQLDTLTASTDPRMQHIGPVPSSSPDSGTCGNDWANDTFDRYFTIRPNRDGTFEVYEQFKNGTFVTTGPATQFSPGACDESDGTPPGLIAPGLTGTMHGYLLTTIICDPLVPTCPIPTATCGPGGVNCQTTAQFIETFFGPGATRNDQAYFFHYTGYDGSNQALTVHEWKNASCNRGGNHGDIASASLPVPPFLQNVCI